MAITVNFTDASTPGPSGPITGWAWDFGDGSTSTSQNPSHDYAASGVYTVTLTITGSGSDGQDSVSNRVTVSEPAGVVADFISTTEVTDSQTVDFTDRSTPGPSGPLTGWSWDFGDSNTSTSQNPSHHYAAAGTYTVTLTVTGTGTDGTGTASHSITVVATGGSGSTNYRPYIATSAINKPIPASPTIHSGSADMISASNNWLLAGTSADAYKEWLGPRNRLHYYRGDTSAIPTVTMHINWSPSGYACDGGGTTTIPMPTWGASVIGPTSQKGDSNVVIVDSVTGDVWELWRVTPPGYASRNVTCDASHWNCLAARHWPGDTKTGDGYTGSPRGTSASKIHLAAGLLVPEDFADCFTGSDPGTVIPHVLRIDGFCGSDGTTYPRYVAPAAGGDGTQPKGIPAGQRVQLDPSINVSTWPSASAKPEPWRSGLKKILRTLQQYGAIQVDSTAARGAGGLDAASPESVVHGSYNGGTGWKYPWDMAGVGWGYGDGIPYDLMGHFRVVTFTGA